jgi:hypothetical protein
VFVHRLTVPIDDFDGLAPLNHWLAELSPRLTVWAMTALLALAEAAGEVGWRGDMRHLPMVGVLPTSYQTTPCLIVPVSAYHLTCWSPYVLIPVSK